MKQFYAIVTAAPVILVMIVYGVILHGIVAHGGHGYIMLEGYSVAVHYISDVMALKGPDKRVDYCGVNYIDLEFNDREGIRYSGDGINIISSEEYRIEDAKYEIVNVLGDYIQYITVVDSNGTPGVFINRAGPNNSLVSVVIVLGQDYGVEQAKLIASRVTPLLAKWGIEDLVIVRAMSNATYERLWDAVRMLDYALSRHPLDAGAPSIVKEYRSLIANKTSVGNYNGYTARSYYTIATSYTGRIDIYVYGISPTMDESVEFVKWVRGVVGYCDIPFYFFFLGPEAPTVKLEPLVVSRPSSESVMSASNGTRLASSIEEAGLAATSSVTESHEYGDLYDLDIKRQGTMVIVLLALASLTLMFLVHRAIQP